MFHRRFVCVTTLLLFGYIHVTSEFLSESNSIEHSKGIRIRPGEEISRNHGLLYTRIGGNPFKKNADNHS
jgi:hypothetical protein